MATDTPIITGTDFVVVPTRDVEKAIPFYRDVLGLRESKRWGNMPAIEFETGSLTIALMQSEAFGLHFNPSTNPIALHVDDYEGAKAKLEANGVEFQGETIDSGVCWQIYFQDPDGNLLGIHHRYAQG